MDVLNKHLVGVRGEDVVVVVPPTKPMTPHEARVLAAWLVVMADIADTDDHAGAEIHPFDAILSAVENS